MSAKWMKGIGGAVLTALAWAAAWAPVAVLFGLGVDPDGSMDEMWAAIGAYPGFLSGLAFCALVALAEGRGRVGELTRARALGWGAAAGLLVGLVPFTIGEPTGAHPLWLVATLFLGSVTVLGGLSGVATASLRRNAGRGRSPARAG
jgi:hypothetical protein